MYFYERTKKTYTQTASKLVLHHHNKFKIPQSLLYHQPADQWNTPFHWADWVSSLASHKSNNHMQIIYLLVLYQDIFFWFSHPQPFFYQNCALLCTPTSSCLWTDQNLFGKLVIVWIFGNFTATYQLTTHILLRNYNQSYCNGVFLTIGIL